MTIVLAVPCQGAVIVGSDTEVSDQRTRTTHLKIKELNGRCLWAGSGEVGVIQRLEECLVSLPDHDRPLAELREPIGLCIRAVVEDALRIDYRVPYVQGDLKQLEALYYCRFTFAEQRAGQGRILTFDTTGGAEWYTHPHAMGSAADFAVALTKNYDRSSLLPERAALLVIAILEQTIETAQSGVDYPLDMWHVDDAGVHHYDGGEMARLYAEAQRLRDAERTLIERWQFGPS